MNIRCLLITGILCGALASTACTTFFISKDGQMVFGRNYDWITETGVIQTNLRNRVKTSLALEEGKTFQWTSKYGSISFNQYGREFPTGGMNEKGLVVELMWLSESQFPKPDQRPALSVLQWIQYQLDNCATIGEVIASDREVRISAGSAPQHYLVADAQGQAATIEFLNGRMVVHKGATLPHPVLANHTYKESLETMNRARASKDSLSFTDNSLVRFSTACNMVNKFRGNGNTSAVDYSFKILDAVSQGGFTKWSIVYDLTNRAIHFKTASRPAIKTLQFSAFDFSCQAQPMSFDMDNRATADISKQFIPYSNDANKIKLARAFEESKSRIVVSSGDMDAMAAVAAGTRCN